MKKVQSELWENRELVQNERVKRFELMMMVLMMTVMMTMTIVMVMVMMMTIVKVMMMIMAACKTYQ